MGSVTNTALTVIGLGLLLIGVEWLLARRKKGGVTWTDRQRMLGLFKVTLGLAALISWMVWMSE